MSEPGLVPCLKALRAEINTLAPNRDKSSDGWAGDAAHQSRTSDHNWDETGNVPIRDADRVNEVHALDVDVDLREPGLTMRMIVQHLLKRCRGGREKRLRYIIFDRKIYEASNSWREREYKGASPHTEHAHFSASYETAREASTVSWGLEEIEVAMTAADKTWIKNVIAAEVTKAVVAGIEPVPARTATAVLSAKIGDKANPGRRVVDVFLDLAKLRGFLAGDLADTQNAALSPTSPIVLLVERIKSLFIASQNEGAKS